ncbi:YbaB/EbfC family nucleoid-associated protein [Mangrovihabitans endophyticus]|uniref:YbaB/EbfC DNA-binding family protein n=1 Tax=Mangrovihabitans endophyticus TaxID=1751298 RepID=A0A8J3FP17_9ACTN|nr:YbaB/EbfC family nucleoid-associated protein [Mangrovihabitans endophyticus]GGK88742.1 hypothetical protein GCM10012284_23480 [Mangrovihabitans endophyticus]
MRDVDAAEEWLDSWVAGVDAQASRAVELSRRVSLLTGEARSRDGSITVAVGPSGQLRTLDIGDRALQSSGAELSGRVMALIRHAQARLSAQVAEQVRQTVGVDTETGRAVIHSYEARFPAPPEGEHGDHPQDRHTR